jgi:hypothetical protein
MSPLVARCKSTPAAIWKSMLCGRSGQPNVRPGVLGSEAEHHLLSTSDVRVGGPLVRLSLRARASFIRNDSPDVTTTIAW